MRLENMELEDTVELMTNGDTNDELRAEYYQAKIRYNELKDFIKKYENNELAWTPKCPLSVLKEKKKRMRSYIEWLEVIASIEYINL